MTNKVLVTGGAGFIGAHLVRQLLEEGHQVRALDNLEPQVHGPGADGRPGCPAYFPDGAELVVGDIRDAGAVSRCLRGVDQVVHLAARVGVGQSMYEMAEYTSVNSYGTAVLLQQLSQQPVERLVVASSMSIYGEGLYATADGQPVPGAERTRAQLSQGQWELMDEDGGALKPVPTPERKPPALSSVYAMGKYDQERLCLMFGQAYGVPTVALRFFNVYGPYQALSNPYTGVLAIFAARLLNGRAPKIFEDGRQMRDFVSVHDVARAVALALARPGAAGQAINVGSGEAAAVLDIALMLARLLGCEELVPEVTGKYRVGDIRHCFADIGLAHRVLGFRPEVDLATGLKELAQWLGGEVAVDSVDQATSELLARGLAR